MYGNICETKSSQVRNEEKARKMFGEDVDLVGYLQVCDDKFGIKIFLLFVAPA